MAQGKSGRFGEPYITRCEIKMGRIFKDSMVCVHTHKFCRGGGPYVEKINDGIGYEKE